MKTWTARLEVSLPGLDSVTIDLYELEGRDEAEAKESAWNYLRKCFGRQSPKLYDVVSPYIEIYDIEVG